MTRQNTDGKTVFKRWYDTNREDFNAQRRAKYAADKEKRNNAIEASREYRRSRKMPRTPIYVKIDGHNRKAYTFDQALDFAGITGSTLQSLHGSGYLPDTTIPGTERLYTKRQMTLIYRAARHLDEGTLLTMPENLINDIHSRWEET